jgi:hypothetical protein
LLPFGFFIGRDFPRPDKSALRKTGLTPVKCYFLVTEEVGNAT